MDGIYSNTTYIAPTMPMMEPAMILRTWSWRRMEPIKM